MQTRVRIGSCGALGALVLALSGCWGGGPTIHVQNIDGPNARLVAWNGAVPVMIPCGGGAVVVPPTGAPPLPWDLKVYDATGGQVLFSHTVGDSGDFYILIRDGGVLWGTSQGSGGPAPIHGCQ
jgi:hypothetical protein